MIKTSLLNSTIFKKETNSSHPLSLKINFAWTFVGNVIYAACQWGMTIALAKIGTPEMVGEFALALAITAPIILFTGLHLRAVQATDARQSYHFSDYLALRLLSMFLAFLIIAGITWVGGYNRELQWIILLIGLAKAFEAISDIFYGLFQQQQRMDRIAKSMVIRGFLSLTTLTVAVLITQLVWVGAAALAITWLLVLMLYDIPNGARILGISRSAELGPRWHLLTLLSLTRLSYPLGLTMMLISLNANIPRYFVEYHWGQRELGFFAAIAYLIMAGSTVVNALGQSASPRLAKYYAYENKQLFFNLLLRLIGIGIILGVLGVMISLFWGKEILTLLYRTEYAQLNHVLAWVMVAAALSYVASFLGYGMTAAHSFTIQPAIFGIVAMVNGLSSLLLIPSYGPLGAAWALGISNGLQMLLSLICVLVALHRLPKGETRPEVVMHEL